MTREQLIVIGLFVAAFLTGWLTHALTARIDRRERAGAIQELAWERALAAARFEVAVDEGRRELGRAITAYHATVASSLAGDGAVTAREGPLEVLARALDALAVAVDHACRELAAGDPLGERLSANGAELRQLAGDVSAHARQQELPGAVFDRLEQQLTSAASAILGRRPLQPQPS